MIVSTVLAIIGLWVLSTGLEGWYRGRLSPLQRGVALVAAILLLLPPVTVVYGIQGYLWNAAGLVVATVLLGARVVERFTGGTRPTPREAG